MNASPFMIASLFVDVAAELKLRYERGPMDLPSTLRVAHYIDALVRAQSGDFRYKEFRAYAHERAYRALVRTLSGEQGYFACAQGHALCPSEVTETLIWLSWELYVLAQRGYKVHTHEIVILRNFFQDATLRIADTPAIRTQLELLK